MTDDVANLLDEMELPDKIGQLIVHLVYGSAADEPDERNRELFGVDTAAEVVARYRLGGVIYFAWAGTTENPAQIARLSNQLQAASTIPLIIGTDQETGRVARLGPPATQFPGAMALAAGHDVGLTREAYAITGRELAAVGINTDFAPVADVNVNPANPVIGTRSFGSEPDVVAEHVTAAIAGLQRDAGVSAAAKHFPGHGDTAVDSHHAPAAITHTLADWETIDALPFRAAIRAGVDLIMTGHLAFPELDPSGDPATLSRPILTGLLREQLGFAKVIITDSLRMAGVRQRYDDGEVAVRAIEAGVDLLLEPADPARAVRALEAAVASGRLSEQRIDASVERILRLKHHRGLFSAEPADLTEVERLVGGAGHRERAAIITGETVTLIRDDEQLFPLQRTRVCLLGADPAAVDRLATALKAGGLEVDELVTGQQPDRELIEAARQRARKAPQTLIVTSGAWRERWQRTLVRMVRETAPRVGLVAVADPYDAGLVADGGSMLLSCSATPVALDAVAEVLLGRREAAGRLPVAVGENPDRPLFPFGAGITPN